MPLSVPNQTHPSLSWNIARTFFDGRLGTEYREDSLSLIGMTGAIESGRANSVVILPDEMNTTLWYSSKPRRAAVIWYEPGASRPKYASPASSVTALPACWADAPRSRAATVTLTPARGWRVPASKTATCSEVGFSLSAAETGSPGRVMVMAAASLLKPAASAMTE